MSVICCIMHFIEKDGQHQKLHTAGLGQGAIIVYILCETTQLPPQKLVLTVSSYKE